MRPSNRQRRILALFAIASVVAVSVAVSTSSAAPRASAFPPNGIYTCDWIAAHPAAATAARVTCDPAVFSAGLSALDSVAPAEPDSTGCQPVPNDGGRVGKGVWAWSQYEYANTWQWTGHYSPSYYTWYIKHTDGTTQVWGENYDTSTHSVGVPSNTYRWGAQNHSDTAQNWTVCYTG